MLANLVKISDNIAEEMCENRLYFLKHYLLAAKREPTAN